MVRMGLKEPEHQDRTWSHPPKKKWIYNYLTVGDEAVEETLSEERVKKPLVYRRAVEPTYTRNAQDPYPRLVQHAHATSHQKGTLPTTTYQRGAPTPPHQQRGAPTPPHQQRGAPTPPHQQRGTPTPPHQQRGAPTPPIQQRGAPTPPHQQRGTPTPPHQQRGAPTPPIQQRGAPTPPHQPRVTPTPPQHYQRGAPTPPQHPREQLLHIQQQYPVVASISSPPVSRTTQPSSPVHIREEPQQQRRRSTLTPPTAGLVTGVWGLNTSIQQSSPRPSLSYPGSPSASPPRATLITRAGQPSPIGLVSAFRHESLTPPAAAVTTLSLAPVAHTSPVNSRSDSPEHMQAYSRLPPTHDTYHSHLHNGLVRPNGLTSVSPVSPAKSLSPTGLSMNGYSSSLYSPDDKDDKKNRSGSTPSREVHNKLEKNRRAHLKECFETLRRQLPSMDDKKISNQTILKAAHRHIQNLKRKEREYEHEMERLAREKIAHQQHLATLKKELSAKWDHIDFNTLLPDMASLDQQRDKETKSTTTASEQPDMDEDDMVDAGTQATPVITATNPRTSLAASSVVPSSRATSTLVNAATIAISNPSSRPISPHVQSLTSRGTTVFSSNNPPITTITTFTPTSLTPVNCLTPGPTLSFTHTTTSNGHIVPQSTTLVNTREFSSDPNQPLNLSTSFGESSRSSPSLSRSPSIAYQMNGEYPMMGRGHVIKEEMDIKEEMGGQMGGWVVAESGGPPGSVTLSRAGGGEYGPPGTTLGPIVSSSGGIQLPAGLVAGGMQINGATGGLLGQPAIQVITPDGCKLLPATADHGAPGKPLTITLAHAGEAGLEGVDDVSGGGPGPMMALALHKNGALHLAAVPSSARQVTQTQVSVGPGGVVTSVPLNLSVASGGTAMRVTQAPTSIIPTNYLPITHANGLSQLVGNVGTLMSPIMAPIMVSGAQQQRTVTATQPNMASQTKSMRTGAHSSVPMVPTQYATSLPHPGALSGLVKPVVMVSASNVMPVQHGTVATITSKP